MAENVLACLGAQRRDRNLPAQRRRFAEFAQRRCAAAHHRAEHDPRLRAIHQRCESGPLRADRRRRCHGSSRRTSPIAPAARRRRTRRSPASIGSRVSTRRDEPGCCRRRETRVLRRCSGCCRAKNSAVRPPMDDATRITGSRGLKASSSRPQVLGEHAQRISSTVPGRSSRCRSGHSCTRACAARHRRATREKLMELLKPLTARTARPGCRCRCRRSAAAGPAHVDELARRRKPPRVAPHRVLLVDPPDQRSRRRR